MTGGQEMDEVEPSFTPGEILRDELEARGWSTGRFAEALGRPVGTASAILDDEVGISADVAADIGQALETGPELWLNLQTNYRSRYMEADPH